MIKAILSSSIKTQLPDLTNLYTKRFYDVDQKVMTKACKQIITYF